MIKRDKDNKNFTIDLTSLKATSIDRTLLQSTHIDTSQIKVYDVNSEELEKFIKELQHDQL